jgi:hypothetical protein
VELVGNWSQTEELLYCLFYVKSLQQARELGEEEASERLGRIDQSGTSILPRKTAGPVPWFYSPTRVAGKSAAVFDEFCRRFWLRSSTNAKMLTYPGSNRLCV